MDLTRNFVSLISFNAHDGLLGLSPFTKAKFKVQGGKIMCSKSQQPYKCKSLVLVPVIYFLSVSLCNLSVQRGFRLALGHTVRDVTPFPLTLRLVSTMLWMIIPFWGYEGSEGKGSCYGFLPGIARQNLVKVGEFRSQAQPKFSGVLAQGRIKSL